MSSTSTCRGLSRAPLDSPVEGEKLGVDGDEGMDIRVGEQFGLRTQTFVIPDMAVKTLAWRKFGWWDLKGEQICGDDVQTVSQSGIAFFSPMDCFRSVVSVLF